MDLVQAFYLLAEGEFEKLTPYLTERGFTVEESARKGKDKEYSIYQTGNSQLIGRFVTQISPRLNIKVNGEDLLETVEEFRKKKKSLEAKV